MASEKTLRSFETRIGSDLSDTAQSWLAGQELLTGSEVGELLGIRSPDKILRRLRATGKLVALPVRAGHLYPAFQFRASDRRLRTDVAHVNSSLHPDWRTRVEYWASTDVEVDRSGHSDLRS